MDAASEIPSGSENNTTNGIGEPASGSPPPPRRAGAVAALLAGLQAGMMGALVMLAWLGVSSAWQGRSFWTTENLMASAFYPADMIRAGFHGRTLSGLSLYLLVYSALGALAALALRDRLSRIRTMLMSIAVGLGWYYVSFRWMWRSLAPALAYLHAEQPMLLGHVIYGLWLGRFPEYLRGNRGQGSGIGDQGAEAPGSVENPSVDPE